MVIEATEAIMCFYRETLNPTVVQSGYIEMYIWGEIDCSVLNYG